MTNRILLIAGFMISLLSNIMAAPIEPGNWDRVRLYGHGNNNWGFSEEEYQFIKDNYWMVTIEKTHGQSVYGKGQTEIASIEAAARIKADNPDGQVLFYWNVGPTWRYLYQSVNDILNIHPDWETDSNTWNFDADGASDWWVSTGVDMINNSDHDGVFIDAAGGKSNQVDAVTSAVNGIVLYNGIWMRSNGVVIGDENMDVSDGYYCESFFCHTVDTSEKAIIYMDALLELPTNKYAICVGNANTLLNPEPAFSLACYLIVAHDKSFWKWQAGAVPGRFIWWLPEYGYALGKPYGPATKQNNVYTRSFEYCDVTVDLNSLTSEIVWSPIKTKPVAYWPLDDGAGDIATDISTNGFDGVVTNASWVSWENGGALDFNGIDSRVTIPSSAFNTISNEITLAMWVYGDTTQPRNDAVFNAVDRDGYRVLNIHLPVSNSGVFWDAGSDGSSFDRTSKIAEASSYEGRWNHWIFTKDSDAGTMKIYLNGALWHSVTGYTKTMEGITAASFGGQIASFSYDGLMHDVQVYDVALDDADVALLYESGEVYPVADSLAATAIEDESVELTLSPLYYGISTSLTYRVATPPEHGSLSGTVPDLIYEPDADYYGSDSFTFVVNDGNVDSAEATVSILVAGVQDAPIADELSMTVPEGGSVDFTLSGLDPEGDSITYSVIAPLNGELSGTAPALTYRPHADYTGFDSFTFTVSDGALSSEAATVLVFVDPSEIEANELVGHWKLDAGLGAMAFDYSGHHHHGTLSAGIWTNGVGSRALDFNGTSASVSLPAAAFNTINNEITIAMWVNGDTTQSRNDSVCYASNTNGRALNIHLPWSNGVVYWDAGSSTGYDRINKAASSAEFMGEWNHWVFTKDTVAGTMKIYLNGELWHSGTGKSKTMNGITDAALGSSTVGNFWYDGMIDDVRLYDQALSAQEIETLFETYRMNGIPVDWLSTYGLSITDLVGSDNPDGDALENLAEYALGGMPTDAESTGYPITVGTLQEGGTNWFEFVYPRRIGSEAELNYQLETCSNLVSNDWTKGTYVEVPITGMLDDHFESVTNRFDSTGKTHEFIRLKVDSE